MTALVSIIMGSKSDWDTMVQAAETLSHLGVPHDVRILSAHRTPDELVAYVDAAEKEGVEVFIAAAGGAAHLAGVVASRTVRPVLGVPMQSPALQGLDSLLSTVQMPSGIPVATFAIGAAGAVNAALFATSILGYAMPEYAKKVQAYRDAKREAILAHPDPRK
jgi:5-(carboxyamino)imidazole ribonucleotide mutase